jgi:hypothetical protein
MAPNYTIGDSSLNCTKWVEKQLSELSPNLVVLCSLIDPESQSLDLFLRPRDTATFG